jgi:hypothetical protein
MATRIFCSVLFISLIVLGCKEERITSPDSYPRQIIIPPHSDIPKEPEIVPILPALQTNEISISPKDRIKQTTSFLSGKWADDPSDPLDAYTKTKGYIDFRANLQKDWKLYTMVALMPFREWLDKYFSEQYSDTILYPFSGPDIPNAFTIYPNASKYILIGLEAGGFLPTLVGDSDEKKTKGLRELNSSLDSISRLNFFLTNKMKINITAAVYQGTAPVIISYLGIMGYDVLEIKSVTFGSLGEVKYLTEEDISKDTNFKKGFVSLEIKFRDKNSKIKTLYYISGNVSNLGLEKDPSILEFLKTQGRFSATFKAASFLLHYDQFTKIRDFILNYTDLIVMDDTGPRIKDLKKDFDIRVFGIYTRPIALWPNMFQQDLKDLHIEQKPLPIPFKYGYGTLNKTYHLIIANRKK